MRQNLINARKASYTQKEMAKKLDVTERQYQRLEAGTSNGTIPLWKKLSLILGKTIDHLLAQTDDKQPNCN